MSSVIDSLNATSSGATPSASASSTAEGADRFLKMLVAQMQNQDPLNPMDNAQITSQMAQINTVTGIENLNNSVQALNAQFVQMQAMQGASLIGHDVTVSGNQLTVKDGVAEAGFSLAGAADAVQVEVLNGAGIVVDKMNLGALSSGRHGFAWDASQVADPSAYTFRVNASAGASAVTATPLMLDRVKSVGLDGSSGLMLDLERSGRVAYGDVHAVN